MRPAPEGPAVRRLTDFAEVETLYRERLAADFTRSERRPLSSLRRSWERGEYEAFGLFEGGVCLGYAFFLRLGRSCLLDYFAVSSRRRGEGLGSLFLQRLTGALAGVDCVLAEVEDPDRAKTAADRDTRERRLRFYRRAGFRETALRSRLFGVDYRLLEAPTGQTHTDDELRTRYTAFYRRVLPRPLFLTQLRVTGGRAADANADSRGGVL